MADDASWYAASHLAGRDLIIGGRISATFSLFLFLFSRRIGRAPRTSCFCPSQL
jgi:hypothetical protein